MNVPPVIGAVVGHGSATLRDLQEIYSAEDAYDLLEIIMVDNYNERLVSQTND